MSYLVDFQTQINQRDFSKLLRLWEEYCASDSVDPDEFIDIIILIKNSEFSKPFGQIIESILPVADLIEDPEKSYTVLKLLIDIQTTNTPSLAERTLQALQKKHGNDPKFSERLRLVGLRTKENFQGALSNYDLLAHMELGNFLYHTGGWGAGEIMEISPVREQLVVEFENVQGRKHITFSNAFKTLVPLGKEHFLVRRFADPDSLEKEARVNPVEIIKMLLRDLGPKTASEIKDELCELVIPEKDWSKWWQNARSKLKKDTLIESPTQLKETFFLRKQEIKHEDQFQIDLKKKQSPNEILLACYNFARDHTTTLKKPEVSESLRKTLNIILEDPSITPAQEMQVSLFSELFFGEKLAKNVEQQIKNLKNIEQLLEEIEILAFKKQVLVAIKEHREDWKEKLADLLFHIPQSALRDFIIQELNKGDKKLLQQKITELAKHPSQHPELFVWYFNKIVSEDAQDLPFGTREGIWQASEAFLILLSQIENSPSFKDLTKKMYNMLSAKRYALVRQLFEGSTPEYVKEFLLLSSKSHTIPDSDTKILRSLAEVPHPELLGKKGKKESRIDINTLWTTEKGYTDMQEKIKHIGTIEMVDNAREIEAARALGDLRENAEYKYALERRSRLQSELKMLSEEMSKARILTKDDIHPNEVSVGSIVDIRNKDGKITPYTILGPWDADPENNVLSFQSKLAQAMVGKKVGDIFDFKDDKLEIVGLKCLL